MAEFRVESSPKMSIFAITLDLWKIGEKFQRLPSTYLARCVVPPWKPGVAVGISLVSAIESKLLLLPVYRWLSWIIGHLGISGDVVDVLAVLRNLENLG
jgi:hypothetical protein